MFLFLGRREQRLDIVIGVQLPPLVLFHLIVHDSSRQRRRRCVLNVKSGGRSRTDSSSSSTPLAHPATVIFLFIFLDRLSGFDNLDRIDRPVLGSLLSCARHLFQRMRQTLPCERLCPGPQPLGDFRRGGEDGNDVLRRERLITLLM